MAAFKAPTVRARQQVVTLLIQWLLARTAVAWALQWAARVRRGNVATDWALFKRR